MCDRSPPALAATATTQQRELVMVIVAPSSGLYRHVMILITNMQRNAYKINNHFLIYNYHIKFRYILHTKS